MITFSFYGTSHGEGYGGTICGLPDGFRFDIDKVNEQLALRKQGYGRSGRQKLADTAVFEGACGNVVTVSGDVKFFVANSSREIRDDITAVRSGHADLVGQARYPDLTARQIAELASARSSVCYVVLGAICKQFLEQKGVFTYHYVERISGISSRNRYVFGESEKQPHFAVLHCPCRYATNLMQQAIDRAREKGNSLGGTVAVGATGVPMGLGEIAPYNERLDAQIACYLVGIPSVKGISFGVGDKFSSLDGVQAHDELAVEKGKIVYATNKCGGIVAGLTTGGDILCHLTVKPIPTVMGVQTVDTQTLQEVPQHFERADTCVVTNVGVIAENILAYVICDRLLRQRG